jgi:opacity protein-like surface antigen
MKKILLMTSSVFAMTSFISSANASVSNLFFKPMGGNVVSTTTYDMFEISRSNQDTDGTAVSQTLDYGYSDRDTLSLSISYTDTDDNSSSNYGNQNGFSNPTLAFSRRIVDDEVIVDLNAAITPDVIDTDDSDMVQGSSGYDFGISVGGESFVGDYFITATMSQVTSDDSGNEAYDKFRFEMKKQIILADQLKLNPAIAWVNSDGANATDFSDTNYKYLSYGASISYDLNADTAVYVGIGNRNYDESDRDETHTIISLKSAF